MFELKDQRVLVLGEGSSGKAACALLCRRGAQVWWGSGREEGETAGDLRWLGDMGVKRVSSLDDLAGSLELGVVCAPVSLGCRWAQALTEVGVPVISELELGYQQSLCLSVAVGGTNGKHCVGSMISEILEQAQRRVRLLGGDGAPLCAAVDETRELDFVAMEVDRDQLEGAKFFRPIVAVLLNIVGGLEDSRSSARTSGQLWARLFANQQPFDWAIVQSEALAQLQASGLALPSKVITFSAENRRADLHLDRTLLVGHLPDWTGPLLDMEKSQVRGPHFSEDMMAALAVGHVLRLPLESMAETLMEWRPPAGRCETLGTIRGVEYVNDARAANPDAVRKAVEAMAQRDRRESNVILLAGGEDAAMDFHDLGPLFSRRVKHAFLFGSARERLRAAWSLFTPCTVADTLLEAVQRSAELAISGDVVLLSPACSCSAASVPSEEPGLVFRNAVASLAGPKSSAAQRGVRAAKTGSKRNRRQP